MSIEIKVPKLSATMEEAKVLRWFKDLGDIVRQGELLVELETDKTALEVEATAAGTLAERGAAEGDTIAVGAVLAVLTAQDSEAPAPAGQTAPSPSAEQARTPSPEAQSASPGNTATAMPPLHRPPPAPVKAILATPLARRLARERGVDLNTVHGTGPRGRIRRRDLEATARLLEQAPPERRAEPARKDPAPAANGVSKMRQAIAAQVSESRRTIPAFTLDRWVDLDLLEEARELFNRKLARQGALRLTMTDLVLQAMADVLALHPRLLEVWVEGTPARLEPVQGVAVGLAVALEDGLMVPVLADLGGKGVEAIAVMRREAIAAARAGRLSATLSAPASISLSNLGTFGIDRFEAIISPGQTAILALGRLHERPVARNGALAVARGAHFTLSVDHRLIDGATGAAFLGALAERIERQTWRL